MELSPFQLLEVMVAVAALLMLGTTNVRTNSTMFAAHTRSWLLLLRPSGISVMNTRCMRLRLCSFSSKQSVHPTS